MLQYLLFLGIIRFYGDYRACSNAPFWDTHTGGEPIKPPRPLTTAVRPGTLTLFSWEVISFRLSAELTVYPTTPLKVLPKPVAAGGLVFGPLTKRDAEIFQSYETPRKTVWLAQAHDGKITELNATVWGGGGAEFAAVPGFLTCAAGDRVGCSQSAAVRVVHVYHHFYERGSLGLGPPLRSSLSSLSFPIIS